MRSMVEIKLPRLAERQEDLPLLERCFVERFAAQYGKPVHGITPRAQVVLSRYLWPGNVREMEYVLGNACMMVEGDAIDVRDLPEHLKVRAAAAEEEDILTLEELSRRDAARVLERTGGNKVRAAKILGINRATLYRLLRQDESKAQTSND